MVMQNDDITKTRVKKQEEKCVDIAKRKKGF